jgi:hypothetical protein
MRHSFGISLVMFLVYMTTFAQDHIPVPHTIPHSTSRICYGYAMGRSAGRSEGNSTCDPATLIPNANDIDFGYFREIDWASVDSLQIGDILYWPGTHAAYVTSVSRDAQGHVIIDNISVAHMSASQWVGVIYESLPAAKTRVGVGNPSYFCKRKQISLTVQNSFGGGNVKIDGSTVSSGSVSADWWRQINLEALNQDYQNVYRIWANWQKSGEQYPTTQNPRTISAGAGDIYTANFTNWSDISFSNSFPGASGGTMSVRDTVRAAPGTVRMPHYTSFNMTAINQEINGILYTFSQWSDGNTSYSRTVTATQHASYTANFVKRLSVSISGPSGAPCATGTWTANAADGFPPYNYQWYQKWDCSGGGGDSPISGGGIGPDRPCDDWTTIGTNSPTLQYYWCGGNGYLRADVTDSRGYVASALHYITGAGGGGGGIDPRTQGSTASEITIELPTEYGLGQNYPNPFNPSTVIRYQLPVTSYVVLKVYNTLGQEVTTLVDGFQEAGFKSVAFDASRMPSGLYFYRLQAGAFLQYRKMLLIK